MFMSEYPAIFRRYFSLIIEIDTTAGFDLNIHITV